MPEPPVFSVVIPSLNQGPYISTAIDSVLGQAAVPAEVIVIDGGSSDGTVEVLRQYGDRITYISEQDSGQGDAVNKGFAMCHGSIIGWLNADDYYYDLNTFTYVADCFASHPAADAVYGGLAFVDRAGGLLHLRYPPSHSIRKLTRIAYLGNTNVFLRKRVIKSVPVRADLHYVLDHEFLLRVASSYSFVRSRRLLGCFRVHEKQKTQTIAEDHKNKERQIRNAAQGVRPDLLYRVITVLYRVQFRILQ